MPGAVVWGSLSPLSGPSGQVTLPGGTALGTLLDPRITNNTVILAQLQTVDVTAFYVKSVVPTAGSAVITLNAAPTGPVVIGYVIVNPATVG